MMGFTCIAKVLVWLYALMMELTKAIKKLRLWLTGYLMSIGERGGMDHAISSIIVTLYYCEY